VLRRPLELGQYLAIRYTERLAETGAVNSVGSRGDSFDNALAESINGPYKTELVRNKGPGRGLDHLELATLEWVDWFNHRRLFEDHGRIPPAEFEANHYRQQLSGHQADAVVVDIEELRRDGVTAVVALTLLPIDVHTHRCPLISNPT
jgi:hypothetical protein